MTSHASLRARFTVRVRNRTAVVTGAALCLALPLAGCSNGGSDDAATPAAPSRSRASTIVPSPPADPQAAEKKAVLSAYSSYWQEQVSAYKAGSVQGTRLKTYAVGAALARVESDLASMKAKGVTTDGRPSHDVRVTELATSKKVPSATLSDCLDISDWKWTYRKTGAAVPSPKTQLTQYRTIVKAEKWGTQWKILSATPQATKCTHG
ncbi:hypothetical protein [Streptomyces sp. NPDC095817]|uniref:hypothetical protein n=1 Tax=Streptomyces sp. NPDC095817 TaxID=3155082 RepID=UPI003323DD06